NANIDRPKRVGLFSYGSGCSSEFYSGVVTPTAKEKLGRMGIAQRLAQRHELSMADYDRLLDLNDAWLFGIQDKTVEKDGYAGIYDRQFAGRGLLVLNKIEGFHRVYEWS
ncbi:MAG: 3-hydroxy-3-methylglutaryl-ACP synthase, partial [Anaerolineae bacterium]|nr:3-hydroxy-3-methylglutaryl-ACP synthase [Anaerolineae bacterium]